MVGFHYIVGFVWGLIRVQYKRFRFDFMGLWLGQSGRGYGGWWWCGGCWGVGRTEGGSRWSQKPIHAILPQPSQFLPNNLIIVFIFTGPGYGYASKLFGNGNLSLRVFLGVPTQKHLIWEGSRWYSFLSSLRFSLPSASCWSSPWFPPKYLSQF